MPEPKDILTVCREWQDYWTAHNEDKLLRFARSAGDEIARLRSDLALLGPVTTPLSGQDCAECGRACCANWIYCPSCASSKRQPGDMSLMRRKT